MVAVHPKLNSKRLRLRGLDKNDVAFIKSLRSNPSVNRYLNRPSGISQKEAEAFVQKVLKGIESGSFRFWVVERQDENELIGSICLWRFSADGLSAELGYELLPEHQGQGFMSEALKAVVDYAFKSRGLLRLSAYTHKHNAASIKLLIKHGFKLLPEVRDEGFPANRVYLLERH